MHRIRFLALFVCLLALAVSLNAQTESATVSGRVVDHSSTPIPKASVSIRNIDTDISSQTRTNDAGMYTFPSVKPGRYVMRVEQQGFQSVDVTGLTFYIQDQVARNFTLEVGSTSESVTVNGEVAAINTADATVGTVVDRTFVENMPLNGRSFQSLIELSPGVAVAPPSGNGESVGQFSVNGQRADANYFTIDGVSANVGSSAGVARFGASGAAGALPGTTTTGGFNNLVSIDALQEFKIVTSTLNPEYGRTPGAQLSFVTRSGTNRFHGDVFDYLRNDAFDANNWFNGYTNVPSLKKPAERQNDFGGVVGGPILRDRLFFFFSYEGLRLKQPESTTEVEPSTTARQQAPANLQPLLNAFPIPTSSDGPLTGIFSASYSNPSTLDATSLRVDYAVNKKVALFGRYDHAPSSFQQNGAAGFYTLSTLDSSNFDTDTFTVGGTIMLTARMIAESRFNYSQYNNTSVITADSFGGAVVPSDTYLFQGYTQASTMNPTLFAFLGPSNWALGSYAQNIQRQYNYVDSMVWTAGHHVFKAGVDFRRLTPTFNYSAYAQYISYPGIQPMLSNTGGSAQVFSYNTSLLRPLFHNLSIYAQDVWQVTPRLSFTYGLRWEFNPPPVSTSSYPLFTVTNLADPANAALAPGGTPLWNTSYSDFAPRVGVAYNLDSRQQTQTVVRAGFGIFYDLGNNGGAGGAFYFPYGRSANYASIQFPLNSTQAAPLPYSLQPPYGQVQAFEPNLAMPRTYQWNVSIERSIGTAQTVTMSYVGAAGRNLLMDEQLAPQAGLNSNFAGIEVSTNDGRSNYDALQLKFQRRMARSLQVLASYTWSHALDNVSSQGYFVPFHSVLSPNANYGNSDFDSRNLFSAALTYNIPAPHLASAPVRALLKDWSVDSLFRGFTASPVNLDTGQDPFQLNLYADAYARPDIVPGQPLYLRGSQYPGGKAINPAAFVAPAGVQQGNLGRNYLRGFGASEEDATFRRRFPIRDQLDVQFQAEVFNIFNHPNFGSPGSSESETNYLTSPLFGLSTQTLNQALSNFSPLYQLGGPRSIQFALKVSF